MTLQQLSKTVDFVQATTPSNANDGETWLDTSQSPPQLKVFDGSANAFVRPRSIQNLDAPVSNAGATQSDIQTAVDNSNTASTVSNNLDAPVSGAGATQSDIANGVDSSNLSDEITSGRTRELLLLLQDKPVPEVQDPLNIQSGLSNFYQTDGDGDYILAPGETTTATRQDDGNFSDFANKSGVEINPNIDLDGVKGLVSSNSGDFTNIYILDSDENVIASKSVTATAGDTVEILTSLNSGNTYYLVSDDGGDSYRTGFHGDGVPYTSGDIDITGGYLDGSSSTNLAQFKEVTALIEKNTGYVTDRFASPTTAPADFKQWNAIQARDVTTGGSTSANPVDFDIYGSQSNVDRPSDNDSAGTDGMTGFRIDVIDTISEVECVLSSDTVDVTKAYLLDAGENIITQVDVRGDSFEFDSNLLGGGTYYIVVDNDGSLYTRGHLQPPDFPYEADSFTIPTAYSNGFELDSEFPSITEISATRTFTTEKIPKTIIADEPFTMRNRVYSENSGSNGQSDYQIATTGDGGHFGIPVLTVVSVKKNGSVLNSANWSFDGTDTVTIDTSSVTIASGDTINIKYDFDVFDSTLQPRAYLNREDTSETSPSISHFRYEYVI